MIFFYKCPGKTGPSDSRHAAASSGRGKGRVPAESSLQSSCFAGLSTEKLSWKAKSKNKWGMRSASTEFFLSHHAEDVDLLLGPMLCNSTSWKEIVVKLSKFLYCLDIFLLFSWGQKRGRSSVTAAGEREEADLACRKECLLLYQRRREQQEGFAWSRCWRKKGSPSPPHLLTPRDKTLVLQCIWSLAT